MTPFLSVAFLLIVSVVYFCQIIAIDVTIPEDILKAKIDERIKTDGDRFQIFFSLKDTDVHGTPKGIQNCKGGKILKGLPMRNSDEEIPTRILPIQSIEFRKDKSVAVLAACDKSNVELFFQNPMTDKENSIATYVLGKLSKPKLIMKAPQEIDEEKFISAGSKPIPSLLVETEENGSQSVTLVYPCQDISDEHQMVNACVRFAPMIY